MWFAPEIAETFLEMLESIFQRSGHFEAVPYSGFETFLASAAKPLGWEPGALRRLCFEHYTGISEPADRKTRTQRNDLCVRCVFAYGRLKPIVIGLDSAYRLTPKDFDNVHRSLTDAGLLASSAELLAHEGSLVLHWRADFPRYTIAFEVTGRAGRDTTLQLLMTVLSRADEVLASVPIRSAFLDFDGHIRSAEVLRERCAMDVSYASAILAYLTEAWSTDTEPTAR
jgi:hypothetical protein